MTTPKIHPGEKLKKNLETVKLIKDKLSKYTKCFNDESVDKALGEFIQDLQREIGFDADSYKFILDHVETEAVVAENISDAQALRAMTLKVIHNTLEKQVIDHLERSNLTALVGETWSLKKKSNGPQYVINTKELSHEFLKVQMIPDETKIMDAISTSGKVEGVETTERFGLAADVIKVGGVQ